MSWQIAFVAFVLQATQSQQVGFYRVPREQLAERLQQVDASPAERYAKLKSLFEKAGCRGEALTEMVVPKLKLPNLICDLPGSAPDVILVTAHHDLAEVGEGAADNWSGSALLPTLFESLSKSPRKWSYRFVAFSGEETGLHGSRHYVQLMKKKQMPRPLAQVNIDTIGMAKTEFWQSRANAVLADKLAYSASRLNLPIGAMNADSVATDDTEPFRDAKVPTISITSITQENWKHLHTPRDTLALVNIAEYDATYRTVALFLAILDLLKAETLASRN